MKVLVVLFSLFFSIKVIVQTKTVEDDFKIKLSKLSKEYKAYLKSHDNSDTGLLYVLNGKVLEDIEGMKSLHNLKQSEIKEATFLAKYYKATFNNKKPLVVIVTKKK